MSYEPPATHRLSHPKEIHYGAARVMYAEPFGQLGRWVFPGGAWSMNEHDAKAVAVVIDGLIKANTVEPAVRALPAMAAQAHLAVQEERRWPS